MITRPLDLESRLSPPPRDLNAVAWVNVGLIVLFFSLLGSRFVLATGLLVELSVIDPESASAVEAPVMVTYRRDNLILFQDGKYTLAELRPHLEAYAKKKPGSVMLVRADKQVSAQALADLGTIAKSVGFENMLLAAEPSRPENPQN